MKYMIKENEEYNILIYGPILSEVSQLTIETPKNYEIEYLNNVKDKTILIAGGIHSFGIGCTACGVMFPNILGRKLKCNIKNISFNERNYLKNTYEFLKKNKLKKTELSILELDYLQQDDEVFNKYIEKVIKKLKEKSNFLICWYSIPQIARSKHKFIEIIKNKYSNNKKIKILDLSYIYEDEYSEMCTHSINYINDTGNIMIYKKLEETIKKNNLIKNNWRNRIWNI